MNETRAIVPCGSCTLCCRFGATPVGVEEQAAQHYDAEVRQVPGIGLAWTLKRNPQTGACVYLDDATGCTIWDRAPAACRAFDCRIEYAGRSRAERRRLGREVPLWKAIFAAGQARLLSALRPPDAATRDRVSESDLTRVPTRAKAERATSSDDQERVETE